MVKSLRVKVSLSFMLLVALLAIAGIMSIMEYKRVWNYIDKVMDNNFISIEQGKRLLDALEKENHGLLIFIVDDNGMGLNAIDSAETVINESIRIAKNYITEKDEEKSIDLIMATYDQYHAQLLQIIEKRKSISLEESIRLYNTNQKQLIKVRDAINNMILINQEAIYRQNESMRENSKRAVMPAAVSIVIAIVFAFLLNFFISQYFIQPINRLIENIRSFYQEKVSIDAKIFSNDEIKTLEREINNLISRLLRNK